MKSSKIIGLGVVCFVIVFAIAVIVVYSLSDVIESQQERNYNRFVSNVDGLTNTFRPLVEECAQKEIELQDRECIKVVTSEYQIQFGTLIKLFGYESHIKELYKFWYADLQFWYDSKKAQLLYFEDQGRLELEIKRFSEIREKAIKERLRSELASQVESGQ